MRCCKNESGMNCLDRTFPQGHILRCTSIIGIIINYMLLVVGFVILAFGVRLGYQEQLETSYIDQQQSAEVSATGDADVAKMLQDQLSRSLSAMSGISVGLIVIGVFSLLVAMLGLCGSVRSSVGCLYCYSVLLVIVLCTQAGMVAMVSTQVTNVDKYVKENIQASAAAKELVVQNGRQGMYLAVFLFILEFVGFIHAVISRFVIKGYKARGSWEEELADVKSQVSGLSGELSKSRLRANATRMD